jgi:hypothetical protein
MSSEKSCRGRRSGFLPPDAPPVIFAHGDRAKQNRQIHRGDEECRKKNLAM